MDLIPAKAQEQAAPEIGLAQEAPALVVSSQQAKGLLRAFVALRHRNYRLFWFGQMISLVGTWMQAIGQEWLVLQLTHSAWQLGVVGAIQFLPVLLFSIFGGVFADRWPKRNVLLCTQSAAMVQAVTLWILAASGHIQIWEIYVLALLLGINNSLDMPTRQAFVVEMVGREDLPNAVALNSSIFNLARIVGPGMGGLIIALTGVNTLFLINATSFIAVLSSLALIRNSELHAMSRNPALQGTAVKTRQSLAEGIAYIRRSPAVMLIILVVGTVSLFGLNFNVSLPLFATEVLKVGAIGYGFLSSAIGVGALLSALWIAWGNRQPTIRGLLISTLAFSIFLTFFSLSQIYPLSLALILLIGFSQIAFAALANTAIQSITPDHLRGRVMSVYMAFFAGSTPIGNLLIGGLALLGGPSIAQLICAILALISALAGWIWRKPAEKDFAKTSLF
ncbi:MAG TPA: MFS transporter [Ktedonobacteraceae bacterium]|nr:MFS transporter [Ktedonobacteraceae bacterium]HVU69858.1 MFS transporter [Ktedonobacteraceae bacterium]